MIFKIGWIVLLAACTVKKADLPEETGVSVQMATEGADKFENYIHSLNIYVFRQDAGGDYTYFSTLAELDSLGIQQLQDGSARGDSKLFTARLAVGKYQLFFVGNGAGRIRGNLQENVTRPEDLLIYGNTGGEEKVYFLGNAVASVVAATAVPLKVTLKRAVSKLILVLEEVPSQIAAISLTIDKIAAGMSINGKLTDSAVVIEKTFERKDNGSGLKDTVVYSLLTFPTIGAASPFSVTFRSVMGEEVRKEMPSLVFLPDKYIRVTGIINAAPGALVSFGLTVSYFIFDFWQDIVLPDFSLIPENP